MAASAGAQQIGPLADASAPARDDRGGTLTLEFENDFFSTTDRHFTHGTKLSYVTAERSPIENDVIARAARYVPFFPDGARARASYSLGQNMYTPEDISQTALIPDDRPYAGWLYAGFGLVAEDPDRERIDNLEIDIGVVGPWSQADTTQRKWHRWFDFDEPRGWRNQIDNEPGVMVLFERTQRGARADLPFGLETEFLPSFGFALGNVMTYASVGGTVRIGGDLSVDYGPPRIRPSLPTGGFLRREDGFNWYLFAAIGGRAVAHNIFLDGNTFSDSHSVDKKYFVGDFQAGLALQYDGWRLAYTHILRTEEFHGQDTPDRFGALSLSYQF
ncbi:lipid A deacylase LpxR family protein [Marivibrio halodurans]|uniref:Lipid A deacylase LpxR family protein n=2 Tax=Marivibrio halodurans TaxID=2039722 RepID=A0A8J7SK52_9PROT|nr:lipid A deacylase LpxR family protein [Marivibrio halodurans]